LKNKFEQAGSVTDPKGAKVGIALGKNYLKNPAIITKQMTSL